MPQKAKSPVNTIASYTEKYVNAYLNTDGGEMYYGVQDDGVVVVRMMDAYKYPMLRWRSGCPIVGICRAFR